jgi:hypothetical protein
MFVWSALAVIAEFYLALTLIGPAAAKIVSVDEPLIEAFRLPLALDRVARRVLITAELLVGFSLAGAIVLPASSVACAALFSSFLAYRTYLLFRFRGRAVCRCGGVPKRIDQSAVVATALQLFLALALARGTIPAQRYWIQHFIGVLVAAGYLMAAFYSYRLRSSSTTEQSDV